MSIQYRPIGFPSQLICNCGEVLSQRDLIIEAHQRRNELTGYSNQYFSAISCDCNEFIWYVHLNYQSDVREITLLTDIVPLEEVDFGSLYEETKEQYNSLLEDYHIELSFPAQLTVTEYIQHHEIDHIIDDIYATLPMIVIRPQTDLVENANLVLVIPYESEGKIYGEIKVNYNLSATDRGQIADLAYGIWDLTNGRYFGTLDSVNWDIQQLMV